MISLEHKGLICFQIITNGIYIREIMLRRGRKVLQWLLWINCVGLVVTRLDVSYGVCTMLYWDIWVHFDIYKRGLDWAYAHKAYGKTKRDPYGWNGQSIGLLGKTNFFLP